MATFDVIFETDEQFVLGFQTDEEFVLDFGTYIGGAGPEWSGPYESIPMWVEQEYDVSGYVMAEDFLVHEIQKYEIPNDSGGLTLSI